MFERMTDRSRRVVAIAKEKAIELGHDSIGPEHLLLGLVVENEGVAAKVLHTFDLRVRTVEAAIRELRPAIHPADRGIDGPPFTTRAKKVLEMSLREALQLGHSYIGTEHLLLGLVREGESLAVQILVRDAGSPGLAGIRQAVIDTLDGYRGAVTVYLSSKMTGDLRRWIDGFNKQVGPLDDSHPLKVLLGEIELAQRKATS